MTIDIHAFACIVFNIVSVQVQFCAVNEIYTSCQNAFFLLEESFVKFRSHRSFDANVFDVFFRNANSFDNFIIAVSRTQIKAQFIKTSFAQSLQIFFGSKGTVGIHMLVNTSFAKFADNAVVLFNFHKRFKVHIRNTGRFFLYGKQQINIAFIVASTANFPHTFANRHNVF